MDEYKTIEKGTEGIYKEKGSKFLAFAHHVDSEDEIKGVIQSYKESYHDARHHCYAWKLGPDDQHYRANDDGEPSGTAGKPILGQINSFELTNVLIVVVRYFGGTKLGVGGLIQAYKQAAYDALNNAEIINKTVNDYYEVFFKYESMNDVMRIVKEDDLAIVSQNFDMECTLTFSIRQKRSRYIAEKFSKMNALKCKLLYSK